MSVQAAQITIVAIAAISLVAWSLAFRFLQRSERICRGKAEKDDDPFERPQTFGAELPQADDPYIITGERVVKIAAKKLAEGMPPRLLDQTQMLGQVRLVSVTENQIDFEVLVRDRANMKSKRHVLLTGQITFEPISVSQTRIKYQLSPRRVRTLLSIGRIVNFLSLFLIAGLGWGLWAFVASSDDPGMRIQSVQMMQVVHMLWPPFLFGGIARRMHNSPKQEIETIIDNVVVLEGV